MPIRTYLLSPLLMHTEIQVLAPIDFETYRSCFARDKRYLEPIDPLAHFDPLIQNFERLAWGMYFWFIVDFPEWTHYAAGGDIEQLTPFKSAEFASMDQSKLHEVTHPDDLVKVLTFSRLWVNFYDIYGLEAIQLFNMSLIFRMMNSKQEFYWIMVQYPDAIFDTQGKMVYAPVFVTDISHIKHDGVPMMNVLNNKNHSCQQFFCMEGHTVSKTEFVLPILTRREKQILQLLTKGHGSKQIASLLHISTKTVDNHRQNMLHKTGSKSSSELVSMGIRFGIV